MKRIYLLIALLSINSTYAADVIVMRDPFSEPQTLKEGGEAKGINELINNFGKGFRRTSEEIDVPELLFKGYVDRGEGLPPMALIQISGKRVHMVQVGDEINIDPSNPRNAIRITKISRLSITVEAGRLGQMKVLR